MFEKVLTPEISQILTRLSERSWMSDFYLAGGTGVALHLGHRLSKDMDFFTSSELETDKLIQKIKEVGKLKVLKEDWGTVIGTLDQVMVSFFSYNYPLLEYPLIFKGIKIASLTDIALMKIVAISQRGSKRDFFDLYAICQKSISLEKLLGYLPQMFKNVDYSLYHLLRSLCYFEDAEKEKNPELLWQVNWERIKVFFNREVKKISRNILE
jgi:predicted nucleotidyltransferase component of viral defense system